MLQGSFMVNIDNKALFFIFGCFLLIAETIFALEFSKEISDAHVSYGWAIQTYEKISMIRK